MNIFYILPIIIPLAGAAIIAILGRFVRKESHIWNLVYAIIANLSLLAVLGIVISFYNNVGSIAPEQLMWNPSSKTLLSAFAVFNMGWLQWWLVLIFTILGSVVTIFSIRYMDHDDRIDRYYFLVLV